MLFCANCVLRDEKMSKINAILYRAYSVVEETRKKLQNSQVHVLVEVWGE